MGRRLCITLAALAQAMSLLKEIKGFGAVNEHSFCRMHKTSLIKTKK